jgi:hypothetical protein
MPSAKDALFGPRVPGHSSPPVLQHSIATQLESLHVDIVCTWMDEITEFRRTRDFRNLYGPANRPGILKLGYGDGKAIKFVDDQMSSTADI